MIASGTFRNSFRSCEPTALFTRIPPKTRLVRGQALDRSTFYFGRGYHMLCLEILMSHISLGRALAIATPNTLYQSMRRGFSSSRK